MEDAERKGWRLPEPAKEQRQKPGSEGNQRESEGEAKQVPQNRPTRHRERLRRTGKTPLLLPVLLKALPAGGRMKPLPRPGDVNELWTEIIDPNPTTTNEATHPTPPRTNQGLPTPSGPA
jgi:hypothetical protein